MLDSHKFVALLFGKFFRGSYTFRKFLTEIYVRAASAYFGKARYCGFHVPFQSRYVHSAFLQKPAYKPVIFK